MNRADLIASVLPKDFINKDKILDMVKLGEALKPGSGKLVADQLLLLDGVYELNQEDYFTLEPHFRTVLDRKIVQFPSLKGFDFCPRGTMASTLLRGGSKEFKRKVALECHNFLGVTNFPACVFKAWEIFLVHSSKTRVTGKPMGYMKFLISNLPEILRGKK